VAQQVRLVDDVDQESDADETVTFALGNQTYEIDLCQWRADQLRAELGYWVEHARKANKPRPTIPAGKRAHAVDIGGNWWETPKGASPEDAAQRKALREKIRAWGDEHGWPNVGDGRGRIPAGLAEAWGKANQAAQPAAS
jgi:hypothetical protein